MSSTVQPADSATSTGTTTTSNPNDDGMSWWYKWLCKIAGVLGGICEYSTWYCHATPKRHCRIMLMYTSSVFTIHMFSLYF